MEVLGPVTARSLADSLGLKDTALVDGALLALETEGRAMRGYFTPHPNPLSRGEGSFLEWCLGERRPVRYKTPLSPRERGRG